MPGICEPTTCGMTYGLWCAGVIGAGPGGDGGQGGVVISWTIT